MGWSSGGVFTRLHSWVADANAGFDIMADRMDSDTNDITQGMMRCRQLDGYNAPAANLPMGGFKHTGVGLAVAATDYARYDQVVPISGSPTLTGNLTVTGNLTAQATLTGGNVVATAAIWQGSAPPTADTIAGDNLYAVHTINGAALAISGPASVAGGLTVSPALQVNGTITAGGHLTVQSGADITGGLVVGTGLTVNGGVSVSNGLTVSGGQFSVTGATQLNGFVTANDGSFSNLTVRGSEFVTTNIQVQGVIAAAGNITTTGLVGGQAGVYDSGNRVYSPVNPPPATAELRVLSDFAASLEPGEAGVLVRAEDGAIGVRRVLLGPLDDSGHRTLYVAGL